MTSRAMKPLPAPTMQERAAAAVSARNLQVVIPDPAGWGTPSVAHVDMSRPRRGLWISTWAALPGFSCTNGRYQHALLPGWQYTREEIEREMIPDLEALAKRGVRPTEATVSTK